MNKKGICLNCKTGMDLFKLDAISEICPNIISWKDNNCPCYVPIKKKRLFAKLFSKIYNAKKQKP